MNLYYDKAFRMAQFKEITAASNIAHFTDDAHFLNAHSHLAIQLSLRNHSKMRFDAVKPHHSLETVAEYLLKAAALRSEHSLENLTEHLFSIGYSASYIAHNLIPTALELAGVAWKIDALKWSEVSLVSARLETLLQNLKESFYHAPLYDEKILIIIPYEEDHTACASILQSQFEITGYETHIALKLPPQDLLYKVNLASFSLIAFSIHSLKGSVSLPLYLKYIRGFFPSIPIALGGAVLPFIHAADFPDINICSVNIDEVLKAAGLDLLSKSLNKYDKGHLK